MRRRLANEDEESDSDEDEADKRARLRAEQKESDLKHAEDLFEGIGVSNNRAAGKHITIQDDNSGEAIDFSTLALFDPKTKDQFTKLRETLAPLLSKNAKKAQYTLFMQEFVKEIVKELPSDQIKKVASGLTTLSNEKMKEEKAAEKGGKKSKAAKTKTSLAGGRDAFKADTSPYDDGLDEYDNPHHFDSLSMANIIAVTTSCEQYDRGRKTEQFRLPFQFTCHVNLVWAQHAYQSPYRISRTAPFAEAARCNASFWRLRCLISR